MSLKFCKIEGKTYVHNTTMTQEHILTCISNVECFYVSDDNILCARYYGEENSRMILGKDVQSYSLTDFLCEYAKFEQEYLDFCTHRYHEDLDSFLIDMAKHLEQIQKE